jgi:hypothetical protein
MSRDNDLKGHLIQRFIGKISGCGRIFADRRQSEVPSFA